ncbi:glutathione S-transferase, C-terminal domain containing protein [Nitzschia inconspicua]|uniref:Glutathione S-transferase, C-terminal domain containing protein n=1 Tax=Nitzschia inconspicua TaxID=303405 RepID=A0A9K3PCU0_9STRA|nr:glutathione S-transferase, C-terminal domain containing protein [Nitzschia inconspicua]
MYNATIESSRTPHPEEFLLFFFGVAIGLGVWFFKSLYNFLHIKSCASIQEQAIKPIKKMGDDTTITIWGFQAMNEYHPGLGITDGSPYVARVECYLRLLKQDYTKRVSVDLSENPRSKLPFANVFGKMVDGSSNILSEIDRALGKEDGHSKNNLLLSIEQRNAAHLILRMFTGSLYWVRYAMNFLTETGREELKTELRRTTPGFLVPLVYPMVINSQVANLMGHGTARVPLMEIVEEGQADLRVLASLLRQSKTPYILGTTEPTVVDTDVYAFVSHLFYDVTPSQMDWVVTIQDELLDLVLYIDRMRNLLFPELDKKEKES